MSETLPDDKKPLLTGELKQLDNLAQFTIIYLVTFGLSAFFLAYVLASRRLGGVAPTALYGFSGSAVAALTSCLDRYATGFETEDGKPFPEKIKEGVGKFNRRFARWLWVRPFLGAVIAPVFVWGISHFAPKSDEWTETLGFTAFMGGLLAKSVVDLIKRLFQNVFHV